MTLGIGDRLLDFAAEIIQLVQRLEGLKVLIRICKEVRAFHRFNSFVHASNLVIELSRQNEGRIKGQKRE